MATDVEGSALPVGKQLLNDIKLAEREKEELRVAVSVFKAQRACEGRIRACLAAKFQAVLKRFRLERMIEEREASNKSARQALTIAALECDLARSKVDLHRWRQRTALLKVRLSSAQEDVERYQRMDALFFRHCELELAHKHSLAAEREDLREQLALLQARLQLQADELASLQSEARQLQSAVAHRDEQLLQMQQNLQLTGQEQQAALAAEQANCVRLQEQLAAVQEMARRTEATLAAQQSRAQQAEQALEQERAMFAANQSLQSGLHSMAQTLDERVQEQLRQAQAALAEKDRREQELQQRLERVQEKLEARSRHLANLQTALQQPDSGTPARGVAAALNSVGAMTQELGAGLTPMSELKLHPVLSQPRPKATSGGAAAAAAAGASRPAETQRPAPAAAADAKGKAAKQAVCEPEAARKAKAKPAGDKGAKKADKRAKAKTAAAAEADQAAGAEADLEQKQPGKQKKAVKHQKRAAPEQANDDSWSEDENAGVPPASKPRQPAGKRAKQQQEKEQTVASKPAAGKEPAEANGELAPAAGGRPVRQRASKAPYWMGSGAASPSAATAAADAGSENEEEEEAAAREVGMPASAARQDGGKKGKKGAKAAQQAPARGEERAALALQQLSAAAIEEPPASARKRKQRDAAAAAAADEEEGRPERLKKKSAGKARLGAQAEPGPVHESPSRDQENAAAVTDGAQRQGAIGSGSGSGAARQDGTGQQQQQQPFRSKLEERPLDALNRNVLAAAERHAQPKPSLGAPALKAGLQHALLAKRSLGGGGNAGSFEGQQPGRRKLLSVSTSYAVAGDALPTQALFGNGFKLPKLPGKGK